MPFFESVFVERPDVTSPAGYAFAHPRPSTPLRLERAYTMRHALESCCARRPRASTMHLTFPHVVLEDPGFEGKGGDGD
jgi:hypothetical protein